jgi:endonuclease-3
MPRESLKDRRTRALAIDRRLEPLYPTGQSLLDHDGPFGLLVAVLLSAQTTDAQVNLVTPGLLRRWPDPSEMATADVGDVAEAIKSVGLYRVKAAHCVAASQMLIADFGGEVPRSVAELTRLPGVGRKTANVVLAQAFGIAEGIAVDTHVYRIAHRLGLAARSADTPDKVEQALTSAYPPALWGTINQRWVRFGREYCQARRPRCQACPLDGLCPSAVK